MAILKVEGLTIEFQMEGGIQPTVTDVSFSLEKGEILALVGESGCGKSVSCMALARLLPEPPARIAAGKVMLQKRDGAVVDVLKLSGRELRKIRGGEIAYIFQEPSVSLNPVFRVGEQIAEAVSLHRPDVADPWAEAVELLRRVGIPEPRDRVSRYPHELSGGMQQRVMIAMAIASRPSVLVADEPTTALDVTIQAQILDLLQSLQKKLGTAVIMITHDLGVIAGMCSRVLVMYGGVVVEEGTVREIFYEPKHPYTWGLLRSIPQKSGEKRKLIPIPGSPPDLIAPPPGCPFVARCPYAMNICNSALPEMTRLSQTHCARCRLLDEGAPRIVWEGNRE